MKNSHFNLFLNTAIGFLSVLLLILLIGLFSRMLYPRMAADRDGGETHLISEVIQIEVLNGCGVSGIANEFSQELRSSGFDVVESGNFDTFDVRETFVLDRAGNRRNAEKVARALGLDESRIIEESSEDFYLDATVVIGADYNQINQ